VSDDTEYTARLLLPGGTWLPLAGTPAWTVVDDGSVPGVLLVQDDDADELVAIDAATGRKRATVLAGRGYVVVLGGRVYALSGSTLVSVDLTTGARIWQATTPVDGYQLFTDGRALYVDREPDAPTLPLSAFAIDDGKPLDPLTVHADLRNVDDSGSSFLDNRLGLLVLSRDDKVDAFG
jgi:outer membrane protein assembly factor BamB